MRIALILLVLVACGGGGSDGPGQTDRFAEFDGLFDRVNALDVTAVPQLRSTGHVRYEGVAVFDLPIPGGGVSYVADLATVVTFDTGAFAMSGGFSDFSAENSDSLTGQLTIGGASFDPTADPASDYQFTADVTGALSRDGTRYDIDGEMAGDFRGRNGDAMAGVVFGDVTNGADVDIFDGRFVATGP